LGWFEWYGGLFAALRAGRLGLGSHLPSSASPTSGLGSFCFAGLAPLGFVLKSLIGEEHLFAGSKYKFGATLRTLQDLVVEFHEPLPLDPFRAAGAVSSFTMGLG
jgi:hypothetical protein